MGLKKLVIFFMIPNIKEVVFFNFGTSVTVKQPSSLLNVCMFKMKSNLKRF